MLCWGKWYKLLDIFSRWGMYTRFWDPEAANPGDQEDHQESFWKVTQEAPSGGFQGAKAQLVDPERLISRTRARKSPGPKNPRVPITFTVLFQGSRSLMALLLFVSLFHGPLHTDSSLTLHHPHPEESQPRPPAPGQTLKGAGVLDRTLHAS